MANVFSVREYEGITYETFMKYGMDEEAAKNIFNQFKEFLCSEKFAKNYDKRLIDYSVKNRKEQIKVNNYVGIISMKNGDSIEILPKIFDSETIDDTEARKIVTRMIKSLHSAKYKTASMSNLQTSKMSLLEVFIRMFIDEALEIAKHGLRANYETISDNLNVYKGKMDFNAQIKYNFAHKERFCVTYDEYTINRPENKLIKSTLLFLSSQTHSNKNSTDIKLLLSMFDGVDESTNYDADFSRCIDERNMIEYELVLSWCKVFLQQKSFNSFSGSTVACAILFQMDKLFESYIAQQTRIALNGVAKVTAQDKKYYLFEYFNDVKTKEFLLKPDIVIRENADVFIMDTKWKCITNKGDIDNGDIYQMYAYHKKYEGCKYVTLVYPDIDRYTAKFKDDYYLLSEGKNLPFMAFTNESMDANVYVIFVDLKQDNSKVQEYIRATYDKFKKINS